MNNKYCLIMTTFSNKKVGKLIIDGLIKNHLAACIQTLPVTSCYRWKGIVNNDREILVLIKTKSRLYTDIVSFIKKFHDYEVPEIIQIPITKGSAEYLAWINKECKKI